MAITSENMHQALEKIDALAIAGMNDQIPQNIFPRIFSPLRHLKSDHIEVSESGGLGLTQVKYPNQAIGFTDPLNGYTKTQYFDEYALGIRFSGTFVEDEKIGAVAKYVRRLAGCVPRTQEYQAAQVFNSGDATTYHACSNTLALFYDTHTLYPGAPATYDTLTNAASLSESSLRAALTQVDSRTDEFGLPVDEEVEYVLFNPALQWKMEELLASTHSPEDSRRAVNPIRRLRDITPVKWKYLTSTTAWYLVCRNTQTGLRFVRRRGMRTNRSGDFMTDAMLYKVSTRYLFLVWHPRGVLANIP